MIWMACVLASGVVGALGAFLYSDRRQKIQERYDREVMRRYLNANRMHDSVAEQRFWNRYDQDEAVQQERERFA